jgi:hypothetical protein
MPEGLKKKTISTPIITPTTKISSSMMILRGLSKGIVSEGRLFRKIYCALFQRGTEMLQVVV